MLDYNKHIVSCFTKAHSGTQVELIRE